MQELRQAYENIRRATIASMTAFIRLYELDLPPALLEYPTAVDFHEEQVRRAAACDVAQREVDRAGQELRCAQDEYARAMRKQKADCDA